MRIRLSTESFDDSTVDRYCCCASEAGAADLDLDLHVRIALLVFVGDLAHHVRPLLAACEDAQRGLLRPRVRCKGHAEGGGQQELPGLHASLLEESEWRPSRVSVNLHAACVAAGVHCPLPICTPDRDAGLGIEQVESRKCERNRKRLTDLEPRLGREAAGHLARIGAAPKPDETERVRPQRLDQHHLPGTCRVGLRRRARADVFRTHPERQRAPDVPCALGHARRRNGGRAPPAGAGCGRLRRRGTAGSSSVASR